LRPEGALQENESENYCLENALCPTSTVGSHHSRQGGSVELPPGPIWLPPMTCRIRTEGHACRCPPAPLPPEYVCSSHPTVAVSSNWVSTQSSDPEHTI